MPNLALWLEGLPNQSLDAGKQLLQELRWNLTVQEKDGIWTVHGGHQLILKTTVKEAVEALIFGMALSYAVIPERILGEFRDAVEKDCQ